MAVGRCGFELLVVVVDGWLLVGWLCLALVRLAVSLGGVDGVVVGRWWCGKGFCLSLVLDGGVPYFPV